MLKQIKSALLYLLFFTILTSCRSITPQQFFNRPYIETCITLEQSGFMACNGEIIEIPANLVVPRYIEQYQALENYFIEREYKHYICVKYPKRCTK